MRAQRGERLKVGFAEEEKDVIDIVVTEDCAKKVKNQKRRDQDKALGHASSVRGGRGRSKFE